MFVYSNDVSKLKTASCTDNRCLWSGPQKACLEQYDANPLSHHKCYQIEQSETAFPDDVKIMFTMFKYNKLVICTYFNFFK